MRSVAFFRPYGRHLHQGFRPARGRRGILPPLGPSQHSAFQRPLHAAAGARIRRRGPLAAAEAALASGTPLEGRLGAVQTLAELASEPSGAAAAEEALHRVLREASGAGAERLRTAAEEALWNAWHRSGIEEVDATLRQGSALMEKEELEAAVRLFSEVIMRIPDYAEGWNKRATAHFMSQDFESSIADCKEVLKLKPRHFGCLAGMGMCYQALGRRREAVECFKQALKVHPGLEGPQRLIQSMELHEVINERLRPQLVRVAQALSEGATSIAGPGAPELACDWDVHRVAAAGEARRTYFIRVRVRSSAPGPSELQSLARFYALRFTCGRIFPLTRLTEGPASFSLKPQEEYRFCWHLAVGHDLRDAAGGLLLLESGGVASVDSPPPEERLVSADLQVQVPTEVTQDEVERLRLGYLYTGTLNLEHLDLGRAAQE